MNKENENGRDRELFLELLEPPIHPLLIHLINRERSQGNSKPQEMVSVQSLYTIDDKKSALIVVIDTNQTIY